MNVLGFDTSNYTTSVAAFDGEGGVNCSRLLDVEPGQLGLRQSDALFSHVKRLPELARQLTEQVPLASIQAVAASTRPRAVEGSYMPCFLAGSSQGRTLAQFLDVPFFDVSHQQGHLAAAAWSAGQMELLEQAFLCWHLSGGTTELLLVTPKGPLPEARRIGGTSDLSAGQLIDRTGKLLGLPFPAGKALDALAREAGTVQPFVAKLSGMELSFSGLENKTRAMRDEGVPAREIAAFAIGSVCQAVARVTRLAQKAYPGLPVLFSGGVASNTTLRQTMPDGIFAAPAYSTDNAMGTAILGWRMRRMDL